MTFFTRDELVAIRDRAHQMHKFWHGDSECVRRKYERLETALDELIGTLTDEEEV